MATKVKCPSGCQAVIEIGEMTVTAAAGREWIDADGNYHSYDPNITTRRYFCTGCQQSFVIRTNSKGEIISD